MRTTRVALMLNALSLTGAPRMAANMLAGIGDRLSVEIYSLQGGPLIDHIRQFGSVTVFPHQSMRGCFARKLTGLRVAAAWARRSPDVIYVNSVAALPLLRHVKVGGVPVLLHVHELDSQIVPFERAYSDLMLRLPRRYIAVSEAAKECFVKRGVEPQRVTVIEDFVRVGDFDGVQQMPFQLEVGARFVVGGSGNPGWCKGVVLWLEMASELTRQVGEDNVRFAWVGVPDNAESWQFREMARKLKIDHLIDFISVTDDPLRYYNRFDVLAVTSWEESFSLVAVENMMLKKPVLCFENGATPEVIGDTGIVVPGFSPKLMADEVFSLMRSPERRRMLGEAARARALECFSAPKQAARILEEIERVARGRC